MMLKVLWSSHIIVFTYIEMWSALEMHAMYDEGVV